MTKISFKQIKNAADIGGANWFFTRGCLCHEVHSDDENEKGSFLRINDAGKITYCAWNNEKKSWKRKVVELDRAKRLAGRANFT